MDDIETHYTPSEVAEALKISPRTLANWRTAGKGPEYVLIGGLVRYPASAVRSWMDAVKAGAVSA